MTWARSEANSPRELARLWRSRFQHTNSVLMSEVCISAQKLTSCLVLPRDFSIENGELTPKLSVRRKVVEQHYAPRIEAVYAEAEAHGHPAHPAPGR